MAIDLRRRRDRTRARRMRVWIGNREVTAKCFKVDRRRGRVGLFLVDLDGRKVAHPLKPEAIRYERRVKHLRVVTRAAI